MATLAIIARVDFLLDLLIVVVQCFNFHPAARVSYYDVSPCILCIYTWAISWDLGYPVY